MVRHIVLLPFHRSKVSYVLDSKFRLTTNDIIFFMKLNTLFKVFLDAAFRYK